MRLWTLLLLLKTERRKWCNYLELLKNSGLHRCLPYPGDFVFNWVSKKEKSIHPCGTASQPGISNRDICSRLYCSGMFHWTISTRLQPLSSAWASKASWSTVKGCKDIQQENCPLAIKNKSVIKAVSPNALAWLQSEPLCHYRNTTNNKPCLCQRVSAWSIQLSAIQMLLRESSKQIKSYNLTWKIKPKKPVLWSLQFLCGK